MFCNKNPEQDHTSKDMIAHCMTQKGRVSFAETCRKLLQENADFLAMINTTKHSKAESQQKYRTKLYRIQKKEDVMHTDLKMVWLTKLFPNIKISKGMIKIKGSSTVLSHYHYHMDPCLDKGKCAMRQIPCACIEYINKLEK